MATVLVVEDERDIRELLRRYLERAGHSVLTAGTGAEAMLLLMDGSADLLLLDLGLPDIDGLEVLQRATEVAVPVIALTARSSVEDRIRGLERGADDYVPAVGPPSAETSYGSGRLRIDDSRHEAWIDGRLVDLTPSEWGVLTTLASRPGRVYSRAELVNRVRGYEFAGYERTIDSHVKNLRRKLGDDAADVVVTVQGIGYRLGIDRDL